MEADLAALLLQLARQGGAATGGALAAVLFFVYLLLTGKLVLRSQYLDMRSQRDAALRELRRTTRTMQAGIKVGERVAGKLKGE